MQSLEKKSSRPRPKSFETETRPETFETETQKNGSRDRDQSRDSITEYTELIYQLVGHVYSLVHLGMAHHRLAGRIPQRHCRL